MGTTYQPGQSANYVRVHEVVYLGGDDAAQAKREKMVADIKTAAAEVIIKHDASSASAGSAGSDGLPVQHLRLIVSSDPAAGAEVSQPSIYPPRRR